MLCQKVSFLDFPWVLDCILATRFNCSLKQIRHAVCSIVLTLRTILSAAVELGILVSQDIDADGAVSAKPFIDNMIHVISECLENFPLCLDSEFFHSFLEPLPSHLRFLCGNFHPLTHMQFEDSAKQKAFEGQTKAITQALSELPAQCSDLELYMSSQEPVLKQIQLIKEHLRTPLWMLMHDFRCLQGEEKLLVEDVRKAVSAVTALQAREDANSDRRTWPQVMGNTLLLLLPLWKLSALAFTKGTDALLRLITRPPFTANHNSQRLLQRLVQVLLSDLGSRARIRARPVSLRLDALYILRVPVGLRSIPCHRIADDRFALLHLLSTVTDEHQGCRRLFAYRDAFLILRCMTGPLQEDIFVGVIAQETKHSEKSNVCTFVTPKYECGSGKPLQLLLKIRKCACSEHCRELVLAQMEIRPHGHLPKCQAEGFET